jgi:hypothetical protein
MASAELPQVALGGAPVWFPVPPWHITQLTFQLATPTGRAVSWHWAQEKPVLPPERSAAWQPWHFPSPRFASNAWNPALAWSIQAGAWPTNVTVPVVWLPVVWQARQSAPVGLGFAIAGWTGGKVEVR